MWAVPRSYFSSQARGRSMNKDTLQLLEALTERVAELRGYL